MTHKAYVLALMSMGNAMQSQIPAALMKAYQTQTYGSEASFELTEVPVPELSSGHILIEVKATNLNPVDNKLLRNDLGVNPALPAILHGDVAGIVSAIGSDVTDFSLGDEVYACAGGFVGTAGALAEFMPADAQLVARKPRSLSFVESAALPLVVITAWESLIDSARVEPDEFVLIHGGVGGIGHVAIQLAKARGARVATTVSSAEAAKLASDLGADDVINYRAEPVADYVQRLTDGQGFDLVYDTVGGSNFENSLQAVRNYGRVVTVYTATDSTTVDLQTAFFKSAAVHTQNMSIPLITGQGREHHGEILQQAAELADAGQLKPLIDPHRFTFAEVNEAHVFFESKQYVGKIVLSS